MANLVLSGLTKRYAEQEVVSAVDLSVASGEFVSLLGPSGCGKTTLLRMLAGLVAPSAGRILLDGADITALPPHRRGLGLVFQSYALFPHLSVADNVAFGLRRQGVRGAALRRRVAEALDLVRLAPLAARLPRQLSGGQQQRVALARAVAPRPRVLLLDEPLSNLDAQLRDEMQIEIRRLQRDLGITSVFVTHDQTEALSLSDRVCVLESGRVQQIGTPEAIYRTPANGFVAGFIGRSNRLSGRIESIDDAGALLRLDGGTKLHGRPDGAVVGDAVEVIIRHHAVQLAPEAAGGPGLPGSIVLRAFSGAQVQRVVRLDSGAELVSEAASVRDGADLPAGARVLARVDPAELFVSARRA